MIHDFIRTRSGSEKNSRNGDSTNYQKKTTFLSGCDIDLCNTHEIGVDFLPVILIIVDEDLSVQLM